MSQSGFLTFITTKQCECVILDSEQFRSATTRNQFHLSSQYKSFLPAIKKLYSIESYLIRTKNIQILAVTFKWERGFPNSNVSLVATFKKSLLVWYIQKQGNRKCQITFLTLIKSCLYESLRQYVKHICIANVSLTDLSYW